MPVMSRLRAYHSVHAIAVVSAFFSTKWGALHAWLGYGVVVVLLIRAGLALTGLPQLGLARFYPQFQGLKLDNAFTHPAISRTLLLAIAACLIGVCGTGIALDKGRALNLANRPYSSTLRSKIAPEAAGEDRKGGPQAKGEREGGLVGDIHELFGNGLMLLVAAHVAYLLLFKRPLARFMLFVPARKPGP